MFHSYFVQPQQIWDTWNKGLKAGFDRLESAGSELDKMQDQGVERSHQAIEETSKLMKESLTYTAQLASEWRKWWLGAAKQTSDLANPGG